MTAHPLLRVSGTLGTAFLLACTKAGVQEVTPAPARAASPVQPATSPPPDGFIALSPDVRFREDRLSAPDGGRVWLYLPEGPPPASGFPLVLVPPAGSNLLQGMALSEGDRAEHLPYVRAGFAVVSFDVAGVPSEDSDAARERAVRQLAAHAFGVQDSAAALDHVLGSLDGIDATRVFVAGHSSAGTLALEYAAVDPRVRAVAAFAPVTNFRWWLFERLGLRRSAFTDARQRVAPLAVAPALRAAVFVFQTATDTKVRVSDTRAYVARLEGLGKDVTYEELPEGGHYDPMIAQGIGAALAFFERQGAAAWTPPDPRWAAAEGARLAGDPERAWTLYRGACEAGVWRACVQSGELGVRRVRSEQEADAVRRDFERGCALSVEGCAPWAHFLTMEGKPERAKEVLESACAKDAMDACVELGRMREAPHQANAPDREGAAALYRRACDAGNAEGCVLLARHHFQPMGHTERFTAEAEQLLTRGCELGSQVACDTLADEQERLARP